MKIKSVTTEEAGINVETEAERIRLLLQEALERHGRSTS